MEGMLLQPFLLPCLHTFRHLSSHFYNHRRRRHRHLHLGAAAVREEYNAASLLDDSEFIEVDYAEEYNAASLLDDSEFIEVGYIASVHGLQGELRVKPSTDFPELRFANPGKRWLSSRVAGKKIVREVELVEGRGQSVNKGWIVSFNDVDTIEKAKQIVGSTLLVKASDRPTLADGEFYVRELVGMKVILKETREPVGTVINVYNFGSSDLLQVKLFSTEINDGISKLENAHSGHLAWIPFVEAIVPDVDMITREMLITPPKGLLELNIRQDNKSKKERRQLQWKERTKLRHKLSAAKRKLRDMGQQHVLEGLSSGDKEQKALLANQVVGIDFKLLQRALQCLKITAKRCDLTGFIDANLSKLSRNTVQVSNRSLLSSAYGEIIDLNHKKGITLLSEGRLAFVFVVSDIKDEEPTVTDGPNSQNIWNPDDQFNIQSLLEDLIISKMKQYRLLSVVFVISSHEIKAYEELFTTHDYFGFDPQKVWLLEEPKLPIVNSDPTAEGIHNILLGSHSEILQSSVGSGGILSLLSSHGIVDKFIESGIEYIEICSFHKNSFVGHPLFFGLVDSCKADVGVKVPENVKDDEEFDMIFSASFLKEMSGRVDALHFHSKRSTTSHVTSIDNQWIDVNPSSSNSYKLRCSIYSTLNACSSERISLIQIAD